MIAQGSGNIVCMTSIAAKRRQPPGEVCYAITKAGIEFFCWGLAQEVQKYNIAVNDLYPAHGVATSGRKAVFQNVQLDAERNRNLKTPEEIAEAVLWITTQNAGIFTGRSVNDDEVKRYIQGIATP
jgi:NAD(P)-dependent dehydrogenase (short-subunit alcohol dehydrogenase family)